MLHRGQNTFPSQSCFLYPFHWIPWLLHHLLRGMISKNYQQCCHGRLVIPLLLLPYNYCQYHLHHLSLNYKGRWGTTDDLTTSFLHFSPFSTALWDLTNSRPVHSLMLSSPLFLCLPCLLPPFTVPCKMILARPDEHETWPYHCSLSLFTMVRRSLCGPIAC